MSGGVRWNAESDVETKSVREEIKWTSARRKCWHSSYERITVFGRYWEREDDTKEICTLHAFKPWAFCRTTRPPRIPVEIGQYWDKRNIWLLWNPKLWVVQRDIRVRHSFSPRVSAAHCYKYNKTAYGRPPTPRHISAGIVSVDSINDRQRWVK